jgi:DNA-binding beta-propeller fold protein YncE
MAICDDLYSKFQVQRYFWSYENTSMKLPFCGFALFAALFCAHPNEAKAQEIGQIWVKIPEKDLIPEGIAYDPARKRLFVSSISKNKIVVIDKNKVVRDFIKTGQDGFGTGVGLHVDPQRKVLWACNNRGDTSMIHQYDLKSDQLIRVFKYSDGKKRLFNDLDIHPDGTVYISDTNHNGIFSIQPQSQKIEKFIESDDLQYPNGIVVQREQLLVASTLRGILRIPINSAEIIPLDPDRRFHSDGIDGLAFFQGSLYGIHNLDQQYFKQRIKRYVLSPALDAITQDKLLEQGNYAFEDPTTGVFAGNRYFCIANSQLEAYNQLGGAINSKSTWKEPVILWYRFDKAGNLVLPKKKK